MEPPSSTPSSMTPDMRPLNINYQLTCEQVDFLLTQARDLLSQNLTAAFQLTHDIQRKLEEDIFAQSPYVRGSAEMLFIRGIIHFYRAEYTDALDTLHQALDRFGSLDDLNGQAKTLNPIGSVYRQLGDFPNAVETFLQSLALCEQTTDKRGMGRSLNGLASIYSNNHEHKIAINYLKRGLEIALELDDRYGQAVLYGNCANEYFELGEYSLALECGLTAVRFLLDSAKPVDALFALYVVARAYHKLGEHDRALTTLQQALQIAVSNQLIERQAQYWQEIAEIELEKGRVAQALIYLNWALAVMQTADYQVNYTVYKTLSATYKRYGDYERALYHLEKYQEIHDNVFTEASSEKLRTLEVRYHPHQQHLDHTPSGRFSQLADEQRDTTNYDLKSLLATILLNAEQLQALIPVNDGQAQQALMNIRHSTQRINELMTQP